MSGAQFSRGALCSGEPFNPRYEACGFFPDETVGRRQDLTDGQKWLYSRMVRWARLEDGNRPNERAGEVWRAHESIAKELGKSEKQVSRDMAKLESVGLLSHRKRDGRKSNTYLFLFHAEFERTPVSAQTNPEPQFERTSTSGQTPSDELAASNLNGHPRPVSPHLNGHPRPPNPKEFNHKAESSSSSTGEIGRFEEPATPALVATTPTTVLDVSDKTNTEETKTPTQPRVWTKEEMGTAREALREHFEARVLPDWEVTRGVLKHMLSVDDVRLWLQDIADRRVNIKGWGFYPHDAGNWPARRADVQQQMEATIAAEKAATSASEMAVQKREEFIQRAREKGWDRIDAKSTCGSCYGFGYLDSGKVCNCYAGRLLPHHLERCDACQNTGMIADPFDAHLAAWCQCVHAVRRREHEPNILEETNSVFQKTRSMDVAAIAHNKGIQTRQPRGIDRVRRTAQMATGGGAL